MVLNRCCQIALRSGSVGHDQSSEAAVSEQGTADAVDSCPTKTPISPARIVEQGIGYPHCTAAFKVPIVILTVAWTTFIHATDRD